MDNVSISLGTIIWICGAITALSAAIAVIKKATTSKITAVTSNVIKDSMTECSQKMQDKLTEMNEVLQDFIKESKESDELIKENMLANARYTINDAHTMYCDRGNIDEHTLYTLEEVYKSYKKLGGNTFIDKQMNELRSLEIRRLPYGY